MTRVGIGHLLLGVALLAGCSKPASRSEQSTPSSAPRSTITGKVTGTVYYRERMALPAGSSVEVTLDDVSNADAPRVRLGSTRILKPGQPPIPFEVPFDPSQVDSTHRYALSAEISFDRKLQFRSDEAVPVLTQGAGRKASILVRRVDDAPAAPLETTRWRLATIEGTEVPAYPGTREIGFALDATTHTVGGFGGCNRFRGGYRASADSLQFGEILSTKMACPNTMDLESRYFSVLATVTTFRIDGNELGLFDATGTRVLRFEAAKP